MRIRTIKPEFWSHPVFSKLDHGCRLLAVALLNYADDHGYFYADCAQIRGALMFREESTNVRRWIDELSRIGYIEIVEHDDFGTLGRVVNFGKHQRVDRPKDSKIAALWGSTTNRRLIDEGSTLEQGTGNREQGKELTPLCPPIEKLEVSPSLDDSPNSTTSIVFYCVGSEEWSATESLVADLVAAFPALDVSAEMRKAALWTKGAVQNRKTKRGMPKFLFGWMSRAAERSGSRQSAAKPSAIEVSSFSGVKEGWQ